METIPIDPNRLKAIRMAAGRERAAVSAATDRLNSALAESDTVSREIRSFENRRGRQHAQEDAGRWNGLHARKRTSEAEVLDASAALETAKDRLSTANQLRSACEHHAGYPIGFGSDYHGE